MFKVPTTANASAIAFTIGAVNSSMSPTTTARARSMAAFQTVASQPRNPSSSVLIFKASKMKSSALFTHPARVEQIPP